MNPVAKLLIGIGLLLIIIGVVWQVGGKHLPFGKLPGDIIIKRENFSFYFPIMTSIIVSVVLTLIFFLISRFR